MGHITSDHIKQSKICLPSSSVTKMYDKLVKEIFDQFINLKKENDILKELKDYLIDKLIFEQILV